MNNRLEFRIGELLGVADPCDLLTREELEELVEGRLESRRLQELEVHAAECCSCSELLSDLDRFRSLVDSGLNVAAERRAFESTDEAMRRKLGLLPQVRRWFRPVLFWLTPAMAVMLLLLLWPRPSAPVLIAEIEPVPLQPPPVVRGLSLSESWNRLEGPWSSGDMEQASLILEEAVELHPGRADLLFYLGVARLRSGAAEEALEPLVRADRIESDAPSEQTRWMLAAALERVGRRQEACDALRSVAEIGGGRSAAAREIVERACR